MKEMIAQIGKVWKGLGGAQRALFLGVLGLVLVGGIAITMVGGSPEWVPLQTGLSNADIQKLVARLEDQGIPLKMADDGTTVKIPRSRYEEARLMATREGIMAKSEAIGFEALQNGSLTMTDKQLDKLQLIAHQNELAKVISSYEDVQDAAVIITPGRRGVAREAHRPAKAAVKVTAAQGATIRPTTVEAIVSMVTQAVEGLEASEVVVTDSEGSVLAGGSMSMEGSTRTAAVAREHGLMLASRANSEFAKAFGPGKVRVSVNADLDLTATESESETYDPESRAIQREVRTSNQSTRVTSQRGTVSTSATQAGSNGGNGESREERSESDYLVSKTRARTVKPGGDVRRLTISVVADESLQPHEAAIAMAAKNAVGFDEKRDAFSLGFVPMQPMPTPVAPVPPSFFQQPSTIEYTRIGLSAIIGIGLLLFLLKASSSARAGVRGALQRMESERAERQKLMAKDRRGELTDDIVDLVDRETDSVGKLLRSWLYEQPAKV